MSASDDEREMVRELFLDALHAFNTLVLSAESRVEHYLI